MSSEVENVKMVEKVDNVETIQTGAQSDSSLDKVMDQFRLALSNASQFSRLEATVTSTQTALKRLRELVDENRLAIKTINVNTEDNRGLLQSAIETAAQVERSVVGRIQSTAMELQGVIKKEKESTKIDLTAMRKDLIKKLNEMISKFAVSREPDSDPLDMMIEYTTPPSHSPTAGSPKPSSDGHVQGLEHQGTEPGEPPVYTPYGGTNSGESFSDENLKMLFDRMERIERSMNLQASVNSTMGDVIKKDVRVDVVYEQLFDKVNTLERDLASFRSYNESIKRSNVELLERIDSLTKTVTEQESKIQLLSSHSVGSSKPSKDDFDPYALPVIQKLEKRQRRGVSLNGPWKEMAPAFAKLLGVAGPEPDEVVNEQVPADEATGLEQQHGTNDWHTAHSNGSGLNTDGEQDEEVEGGVYIPEDVLYIETSTDCYTVDESDAMMDRLAFLEKSFHAGESSQRKETKRLVALLEDLRMELDIVKARNHHGHHSSHGSAGHADVSVEEAAAIAENNEIEEMLLDLKTVWHEIEQDFTFGLDKLGDAPSIAHSPIIRDAALFLHSLVAFMATFESGSGQTPMESLDELHPKLDKLTMEAEELLKKDTKARESEEMEFSLDDILCSDESARLRQKLQEALTESIDTLDSRVDKIGMRRRIDLLESSIGRAAPLQKLVEFEKDIRHQLLGKAELKLVEDLTSKKASVQELQRLKEQVLFQLDDLQGLQYKGPDSGESVGGGDGGGGGGGGGKANNGGDKLQASSAGRSRGGGVDIVEFQEMKQRFEMLYRQFQDLERFNKQFVPRDEVTEAMQAVLNEVKLIKQTTVNNRSFKEGLKAKADNGEVQRLITALKEAMGNLEARSSSAAVHIRCLTCDKPSDIIPPPKPIGKQLELSRSVGQLPGGFDKREAEALGRPSSGGQAQSRLGASLSRITQERVQGGRAAPTDRDDKARISAELTVVRNTIDLPPLASIGDHFDDTPQGLRASQQLELERITLPTTAGENSTAAQKQHAQISYKQRIRSSAGGGLGSNHKTNTR